jgi:DNA-binding protein H-NS
MTLDALVELRTKITQELADRSKELQEQLERIAGHVGIRHRIGGGGRHNPLKGKSVPVTHRGPEPGQEWRGRGQHPRWLAALLKQGHSADEYLVNKLAATASAKRPVKRSRRKGRKAKTAKA